MSKNQPNTTWIINHSQKGNYDMITKTFGQYESYFPTIELANMIIKEHNLKDCQPERYKIESIEIYYEKTL